ncbi:MAG: tyrosine-type recombinase/integrase, partial [Rubricoccaceae bacterium]|nr:tyrosine-type recombinase/integrase [Rubricoccaceae bacterium]
CCGPFNICETCVTYENSYYRKLQMDRNESKKLQSLAKTGSAATLHDGNHSLDVDLLPLYMLRFDSENTRRSYGNDLAQFFASEIITLRMAQAVTFVTVNEHLEQLGAEGAKASTLQRRVAALRGFFAWLVALQLMDHNPADRNLVRRLPRVNRKDRVMTVLTKDEARKLLSAVELDKKSGVRNQTLMLVLLHCVLRRSEAQAMDFEHLRKIDRYWVLDLPSTKGGADQYIKVPGHVAVSIHAHAEHYGYTSGPVWRSLSPNNYGKRLSATSIYNIVNKTARKAGIVERVGAHTLRHTGCTLAIESGASLQQVQAHARHKNLETTMIYVHQRDRLADSAADYIDLDDG